jgi:pyruvate dehydrogenase E2 component (dihydrolipoamide acetyltransferase)
MPIEVEMPKLGLTMEEGTVVGWLKAAGDQVEKGESLFVLETDKITVEAEAPESGVLGQILVTPGTTVATGTPVGLIYQAGEEPPVTPEVSIESGPPAPASRPGQVRSTPVARQLAKEAGLALDEIAGTGPGGRVTSRDVKKALAAQAPAAPVAQPGTPPPPAQTRHKVKASPRARQLARETGLDLGRVQGTGKGGRVMVADVQRALAQDAPGDPEAIQAPAGDTAPPAAKDVPSVIPLTGTRGVIARRMAASAHTAAAVTTTTQADATDLVRLRQDLRQEWAATRGLSPSFNDLLLVILAKALAEFPYVNAHIVDDEIRLQESINIGLAVDTGRGLIVPVIKGLQRMTLDGVARASQELVRRAREGKLLPDDVSGGTFTLSNLGAYDVDASTPLLNLPEVAILGVGRIALRPAAFEGELALRQTVTLSLTYDHRAIDGAPAARFLERVKALIERPHLALVR